MEKAVKVIVSGKVQGVGFRSFLSTLAEKIGVNGWVRNRTNGTVEAMFQGEEAFVDAMLRKCKEGPPRARILRMDVEEAKDIVDKGFKQLPTV